MSGEWRDRLAGARMQVDQHFNDRVLNSQFTNQQWGLIMTAVEFEIENPDEPAEAELVANTDKLDQVMPELDKLPQGMGASPGSRQGDSGGGLLGNIRDLLPGGGTTDSGVDQEKLDAATVLVGEYAVELQQFLEEQGRWEDVCESAARTR